MRNPPSAAVLDLDLRVSGLPRGEISVVLQFDPSPRSRRRPKPTPAEDGRARTWLLGNGCDRSQAESPDEPILES